MTIIHTVDKKKIEIEVWVNAHHIVSFGDED